MIVLWLLWHLFTASSCSPIAPNYVKIKEFHSHISAPTFANISYEVANETFLNYNMTIFRVYNVDILSTIIIKKLEKNRMVSVLRWNNLDYCKFLEVYNTNRIMRYIFSKLFQPTFVRSCPLREGFFYLKNAYMDANLAANILTPGTYNLQADISFVRDGIQRVLMASMGLQLT